MKLQRLTIIIIIFMSFIPLILLTETSAFKFLEIVPDEARSKAIMAISSTLFGFVGFILLWWQFVLGFRKILAKYIVDNVWIIDVHKLIGKYAILLVFLHPILLIFSLGFDYGIEFVQPSLATEYKQLMFLGNISLSLILIIWLSSLILRSRLAYRPWRYIHYIGIIILPLVYIHGTGIGSALREVPALKLYIDLLFILFVIGLIWRILYQLGISRYRYTLISKKLLGNDTFEYVFEPVKKNSFIKFKSGQYAYLKFGFFSEDHPFSVVSFDNQTGKITFGIKTFGKFTKKLEKLDIDKVVSIDGPYGVFTSEAIDSQRGIVLIAGGIGITPFINLPNVIDPNRIKLFYGNVSSKSIPYKDKLDATLKENVVYVVSGSDEVPENMEKGYITLEIMQKYLGDDLSKYDYFVCGPKVMMDILKDTLVSNQVDVGQIHMEEFAN